MKKKLLFFIAFLILVTAGIFFFVRKSQAPMQDSHQSSVISNQNAANNNRQTNQDNQSAVLPQAYPVGDISDQKNQNTLIETQTIDPIDNAAARITKKPFGIFITPKNSPVSPERFQGYHTAVDLETIPAEHNFNVPVVALCDGKLLISRFASGYGGVAVQSCVLDGKDVTVVYGHINFASVKNKVGDQVKAGDFLVNLGKGFSAQTNGERKHLHLAIHIGKNINILGYVQNEANLGEWIDPIGYL